MSNFDDQLIAVATDFAARIAELVRANINHAFGANAPVVKKSAKAKSPATPQEKHTFPDHCPYPGCTNKQGGPRWSFLCEEHRGISKPEKKKILAAWKKARDGKPAKKAAVAAKPAKPAKKRAARKISAEGRKRMREGALKAAKARAAKKKAAVAK